MLGTKLYKNKYQSSEYTKLALYCNKNNCHIEDKGEYYEAVENKKVEPLPIDTTPTLEERMQTLEAENESMNDMILGLVEVIDSL